jgi:hypothetical protein
MHFAKSGADWYILPENGDAHFNYFPFPVTKATPDKTSTTQSVMIASDICG